ncbi:hypothetical protein ACA910_021458 [Epithemia clementina (nom. ined.)]
MLQRSFPTSKPISFSVKASQSSAIKITRLQMKGIATLSLFLFSNAVAAERIATLNQMNAYYPNSRNNEVANDETDTSEAPGSQHDESSSSCRSDTPTNESNNGRCPTSPKTHSTTAPSTPTVLSKRELDYEPKQQQEEGHGRNNNDIAAAANINYNFHGESKEEWCPKCLEACGWIPRGGHGSATVEAMADFVAGAENAATAGTTPYGIPLNAWKVIMQAFLTAINVFCWLGPLQSKKISDNQLALSLANAFSGGVFLSLAFFHLIPECIHGFDPAIWPEAAPFAMVLAGYLLIFFVEKVAFDAHDIMHEMQQGGGGITREDDNMSSSENHHHYHPSISNTVSTETMTTNQEHNSATPTILSTTTKQPSKAEHAASTVSSHSVAASVDSSSSHSSGRSAIILLGALGVHSILEMMALGLSDTFGDAALLTTSIALHQPAESIALLVAFLKSGMPKAQIIRSLSIFSCMGPVGVALGMAVNQYAAPVVDSMMLAIVAGTFVYVGATEVIPEEWEDSSHKWKKFAALMSGIAMIVAVTQYTSTWGS